MMPPPAADDVSPLRSEMMQIAARSMMRCLPSCAAGTHHQRSGIMCAARIICPAGQTSFKNALLSEDKRALLMVIHRGFEPRTP